MVKNKNNSEHYIWGDNCEGWRMADCEELSIIQEAMPPGTAEKEHHHNKARQFFYILKGEAEIEINGKIFQLDEKEGIEIAPGTAHRIFNNSGEDIDFLVISSPTTKGDRVNHQ